MGDTTTRWAPATWDRYRRALARRGSPAGTDAIVRSAQADGRRRWSAVASAVHRTIVTDDVFGLASPTANVDVPAAPPFPFRTLPHGPARAVDVYMRWFEELVNTQVLEVSAIQGRWTDVYIRAGWGRGLDQAEAALKAGGLPLPGRPGPSRPEALRILQQRTWGELTGAGAATYQGVGRVLTEVLSKAGPSRIAAHQAAAGQVRKIGKARTLLIGDTEVQRAHAAATLDLYERAGVDGVTVMAEYATAGDDRVCDDCAGLEGHTFTIDDARGLIPMHPRCRCTWLPLPPDTSGARANRYPPVPRHMLAAARLRARRHNAHLRHGSHHG